MATPSSEHVTVIPYTFDTHEWAILTCLYFQYSLMNANNSRYSLARWRRAQKWLHIERHDDEGKVERIWTMERDQKIWHDADQIKPSWGLQSWFWRGVLKLFVPLVGLLFRLPGLNAHNWQRKTYSYGALHGWLRASCASGCAGRSSSY